MSTLKANKVRNVSATVDNLELDSAGNVSVYGVVMDDDFLPQEGY